MKLLTSPRVIALALFFIANSQFSNAQVKIGLDSVAKNPHPSAVLELSSTNKGFLLPRLTYSEMLQVKEPANGLMVFNKDAGGVYLYNLSQKLWLPIAVNQAGMLASDSCEWVYDTIAKRVYLRRGLAGEDSIFYSTEAKKFVFADKIMYNNSLGQPEFPVTNFTGKYYFKGTASRFKDETNLNPNLMNIFMEIDSSGMNTGFSGIQLVAVNNPKNMQVVGSMNALSANTLHSGQDTANFVNGITNSVSINGNGYAENVNGLTNSLRISTLSRNNVGTMTGITNSMTRSAAATGRIEGNIYGYFGSMGGFTNKVDGSMYGIYLNTVSGAAPRQNFAIYTNKGHHRFGDSVLITDIFAVNPRAVFDINATSAMILPVGTNAQRPPVGFAGMLRYNSNIATPEYYNGSSWLGLGSGSSEWVFDPITRRVNLVRGLVAKDTIFYNDSTRRFVFADRYTNTNSQGTDFPIDDFRSKYTFKGTASQRMDSTQGGSVTQVTYEVDNDTTNFNGYNSLQTTAVMNPKAFQHAGSLSGISNTTIHAGNDTVDLVQGIVNQSRSSGFGKSGSIIGIDNSTRISTNGILLNTGNDAGEMIGFRNTVSRSGANTGRVTGNVYGWYGSIGGFFNKIDGNIYGIYQNSISGAAAGKNFAWYSNSGTNRFGDSMLVTNVGAINPRAIFDINATSAMILPAGTMAQRPTTGISGMLRYNNTNTSTEFFNGTVWKGLNSDSTEWKYDSVAKRVNLVRGLPVKDTIFYSPSTRKFIFADRYTNTNSQGTNFPIDAFNGKYTFKGTASQRTDSTQSGGPVTLVTYEVDNDPANGNSYTSLQTTAVMNPKANQKAGQLSGISNTTIHAGNDSVDLVQGIVNQARSSGFGKSGSIIGIDNSTRISTNGILLNTGNDAGEMIGFRNTVSRSGANTGRVTGNVYGWYGTVSGFTSKVDGNIYSIYLNSVTGAATGKNFAFYSNTGANRFGDSVLVTNVGAVNPRAVFDINATSAMIIPTGTAAQRPITALTGMERYNTTTNNPETYNGSQWVGIIRASVSIVVPVLPNKGGATVSIAVPGATTGSAVAISPTSALPAGAIISWSRVSAANTVEVRFENNGSGNLAVPTQNYNIRVIQ